MLDSVRTDENFTRRNYRPAIIILTIVLIAAITLLLNLPGIKTVNVSDVMILPKLNAIFNACTLVFLIGALIAILKGNVKVHKRFIYAALVATVLFLVTYVVFHSIVSATPYGGEGLMKVIYYVILVSHIMLAMAVIPLVLTSITSTWNRDFVRHKKISRWTMPIWMYVSFTGIVVYFLVRPYY